MGLLTLYSSLLLPWLGGTCWLMFAESYFKTDVRANRFRQAGYGFFAGYLVLFLAIMANDKLTGTVSWPGVMLFLSLFAIGGGVAAWFSRTKPDTPVPLNLPTLSSSQKALISIIVTLMVIHLVFITMEVFTQAVFPWDAWQTWIYRSKAWYLTGSMAEVSGSVEWASATSAEFYTVAGWGYPLFPSVIPYWSALSLGYWSETLVGLPTLFAGLAIVMALYGQCREQGLSVFYATIVCYLLLSIPLFGTHIALAGYADIWMAGFTGLGFVALMRGALRQHTASSRWQLLTGLLMIVFGIWVKNEGTVWLLAALTLLLLVSFRPRVPLLFLTAVLVAGSLAYFAGFTHVDIPAIGTFGYRDGQVIIPFVGHFVLETHDVSMVYWRNLFQLGNWNLLWVVVAASLLSALFFRHRESNRQAKFVAFSLVLIVVLIQLFIFGMTDQGIWADTYTAINRLPLHFAPALLFAGVMMMHANLSHDISAGAIDDKNGAQVRAGTHHLRFRYLPLLGISLLAAAIVFLGATILLERDTTDSPGEVHSYQPTDFGFAFGAGHSTEQYLQVNEFANGYALASSGPVSIQAESQPVLEYTWLPPSAQHEAAFFWRRGDDQQNVVRTDITKAGTRLLNLAIEPDWRGEITEFGFLLSGTSGETVSLGVSRLLPDSLGTRMRLSWHSWTSFEEWTQQSINFIRGGDTPGAIALPLLVSSWLLVALLLLWLYTNFSKPMQERLTLDMVGLLFLIAWLILDVRWTANNLRQVHQSYQTHRLTDSSQRLSTGLDAGIHQFIEELKSDRLSDEPSRILLIGDESPMDYYMLRAKYHLLPHSSSITGYLGGKVDPDTLDHVIYFGQASNITRVPGWNRAWRDALIQVSESEWGTVYRVK